MNTRIPPMIISRSSLTKEIYSNFEIIPSQTNRTASSMAASAAAAVTTVTFFLLISSIHSSFPSNPWQLFQNLSGCALGDHNPLLPDLKSYLRRFGYLPPPPSNFSDLFDADLSAAILTYQRNLGLSPTGFLDPPTLHLISRPRCGVADTSPNGAASHGRHLYNYFPGRPSWPSDKRVLTYALTATSDVSVDMTTLQSAFSRAFARWSEATTLNFTEAAPDSGEADIKIGFYRGDHGDGEAFDGVLGTLGHAFSPTDGRLHLDAAEEWVAAGDVTAEGSENAVDLESVAVHEIGHLLGLGHSPASEAVMYPSLGTRTRKVELARDDVEGIQGLYGENPSYREAPAGRSSQETTSGEAAPPPGMVVAVALAMAAFVWLTIDL